MIQHYLEIARPYLERYGYASVFGVVLVEGFGIPAPGQTLIIAAAVLASEGKFNIVVLLTLAWTAAVIGDSIGFAIGYAGGRAVRNRTGISGKATRMEYAQRFFVKYGGGIVIVARFFEILRQLNGVVAGSIGMPWWRFFA
ncbi:MAG TPA: DedA family protein, partial [Nitrospiria bacterium]|nr:DedA family protein [Nitrospiria bacterium]